MFKKLLNELIEKLCCKHDWKEYDRWEVILPYYLYVRNVVKLGKLNQIEDNIS